MKNLPAATNTMDSYVPQLVCNAKQESPSNLSYLIHQQRLSKSQITVPKLGQNYRLINQTEGPQVFYGFLQFFFLHPYFPSILPLNPSSTPVPNLWHKVPARMQHGATCSMPRNASHKDSPQINQQVQTIAFASIRLNIIMVPFSCRGNMCNSSMFKRSDREYCADVFWQSLRLA